MTPGCLVKLGFKKPYYMASVRDRTLTFSTDEVGNVGIFLRQLPVTGTATFLTAVVMTSMGEAYAYIDQIEVL